MYHSGVNYINVLKAAFACTDPKSTKKTVELSVFFALSGSARVKASPRRLVKLTTGVNFTNSFEQLMCQYSFNKK